MIRRHSAGFLFAAALAIFSVNCGSEGSGGTGAPSASGPGSAAVPAESKTLARLVVDPAGSVTFDMKAPIENIKGLVSGFGGSLELELADLTKSTGAITIDLSTLETRTFGEEAKDQEQTKHALGWMEVGENTPEDKRSKLKLATFTLKEILSASPQNVAAATGDTRPVTATVKGELSLHGRSVAITAELSCAFQFDGTTLKQVSVKALKPVLVNLKAHDIQPRDDKGEVLIAKALELFGKKVADDASVTFEFVARPKGAAAFGAPTIPPSAAPLPPPSASASASSTASAAASGTVNAVPPQQKK